MVSVENSFQLLFMSRLAPSSNWEVVKDIVAAARHHNSAQGLTGALLFDGERFCELIEGAEASVRALLDSISADPRHSDVRVLFAGPATGGRTTKRWVSGYCESHELEVFDSAPGPGEGVVLHWFLSVLHGADVE